MGLVSLGACVAGFVLDFIFGDPVWLYYMLKYEFILSNSV